MKVETYSEPTGEEEAAEQQQALVKADVRHAVQALDTPAQAKPQITAAQAKVEAVASLTFKAYERASTLQLTPDEIAALQAEFPDEAFKPGAAGKEHLIYIEHAFLRDRLNQVIGVGQWALIPRNRWAEDFTTAKGAPASRVYVEAMLVVRGAFVAEAVGEMEYWKNNAGQNYADAVEGAKTAALRRCCKEFGIGLQAWKKDWCEGWWRRKHGKPDPARAPQRQSTSAPAKPQPAAKPAATQATAQATEDQRAKLIQRIPGGAREYYREFFERCGALLPNEGLEDLPLDYVPSTQGQFEALMKAVDDFAAGDEARLPYPRHEPQVAEPKGKAAVINVGPGRVTHSSDAADQPWYGVVVPVPRKGMKRDEYLQQPDTIGSLYEARHGTDDTAQEARQRLYGFLNNYEPKG